MIFSSGAYKFWDIDFEAEPNAGNGSGGPYTKEIVVPELSWATNNAAIAGQVMRRQGQVDVGFPPNTYVFIYGSLNNVLYNGDCGSSGPLNYYGIQIRNTVDRSRKKFMVAHEIGHAIGDAHAQFYDIRSNDTAAAVSPYCKCDHLHPAQDAHCLQSREFIQHAQSEGWAHQSSDRYVRSNV